jgi:hypothetical protein
MQVVVVVVLGLVLNLQVHLVAVMVEQQLVHLHPQRELLILEEAVVVVLAVVQLMLTQHIQQVQQVVQVL